MVCRQEQKDVNVRKYDKQTTKEHTESLCTKSLMPLCRARFKDICNSDLEYRAVLQGMGNRMAFDFAIKCPRCKAIGGISFERSRMPLMFMSHTERLPRYAFYNLAPHRVVVLAEDVKI